MKGFCILLVLFYSGTLVAAGKGHTLFRYKNADGHLVMNSVLPPEFAGKGYEIIDMDSRVLEVVAPQLSEEELNLLAAEKDANALALIKEKEQEKRDIELKRIYGTGDDAKRTRDRQFDALELQKDYVKSSIIQLKGKLNIELDKAADMEREGKKVGNVLKEDISSLNRQIESAEKMIGKYEGEQDSLLKEYEGILARFVEMETRKKKAAKSSSAKK